MLTQARASELFIYSNGQLLRRIRRGRANQGDIAGSVCTDGRLQVHVDGKMHYVHRVIYLMHHGEVPEFVDHVDGDFRNNRVDNLRPASRAENNRNANMRRDNTSGVKGVGLHKGKWRARVTVDGKQVHLGEFRDKAEAERVVKEARERLHGDFHKHQ
jgi:hypothetical protein